MFIIFDYQRVYLLVEEPEQPYNRTCAAKEQSGNDGTCGYPYHMHWHIVDGPQVLDHAQRILHLAD